jgi:hypothetical protein
MEVGRVAINGKFDVTVLQVFVTSVSRGERHISGPAPKRRD